MRIEVRDITLRAGERTFFSHTSWTLEPGQHWAIYGGTGSGKSTLAQALARGNGLLHGQIEYWPDEQASRPYVYPNEIVFFSAETHRAFIQRFAGYHQARWQSFEGEEAPTAAELLSGEGGGSSTYERVAALLDIAPLLTRRMHQLSNGESRKIFLAYLLLHSPRLIILDDPYTGLDQASHARLRAGIEALLEQTSPAILLVSARLGDIPPGITHLLLVEDGQVVAQGEAATLHERAARLSQANPDRQSETTNPDALHARAAAYANSLAAGGYQAGQEVIQLDAVSVSYPPGEVLHQITWTVRQGERWALSGPNGAGKSTLLSLILADHPQAYRNHLRLFGRRRGSGESIWEIKRKIGWVSPELQIFYERPLSCFETVCSGFFDSVGLYRQPDETQQAVASGWVEAFGLDQLADRPLLQLSAGQQRLALLARAMVKHPPLLILDEPCQGLDARQRTAFLDLLDALCSQAPLTLVYVSHDPEEIPQAVTHHLRLEKGHIAFCGKR